MLEANYLTDQNICELWPYNNQQRIKGKNKIIAYRTFKSLVNTDETTVNNCIHYRHNLNYPIMICSSRCAETAMQ